MDQIVHKLQIILPGVSFVVHDSFYWSPKSSEVFYDNQESKENIWSLIHEASHAKLGHKNYKSDFDLLTMEMKAWECAKEIGSNLGVLIDEDHIQDCLDTYRDWLHQRSTCPGCSNVCFQSSSNEYKCHNCYTSWKVSNSRFCRPYRSVNKTISDNPPSKQRSYFK